MKRTVILFRLLLFASPAASPAADQPVPHGRVSFNRDIRPILADTCFQCHGFDALSRKAGMRLDLRDEALKPTKNGLIPIVPGKPDESEIILRIADPLEPMPPEEAHKTLTGAQKDLLRRWVAEGAVYESHWAYVPLARPPVPQNGHANPVDAFVRATLATKRIAPSPEAPKAKLLRRLSLDLSGLPPTPGEVEAFNADTTAKAYATQVDRLLHSPRFGERMAVWWLDIVRFADTVGYHGDQNQRIFPYRDYVINAFNANKRFDQFTIEQLAGDLLPDPTQEQIVATGYNRLTMMTREGGAQPQEYLAKYGAERVRAVGAAWFGSTLGCAECHDHKFDPIKTVDFYALQAFFADVEQWGVYYNGYTKKPELAGLSVEHPFPPEIEVASPYLLKRLKQAEGELAAHLTAVRAALDRDAKLRSAQENWIAESRDFLSREPTGWSLPPATAELLRDGKPQAAELVTVREDQTVELRKALGRTGQLRITLRTGAGPIAALRIDLLADHRSTEERSEDRKKQTPLRLAASIRAADGRERPVTFHFADATELEPRFKNGAEIVGVTGGWKMPYRESERLPASVWLLDRPVWLAADETLIATISGDPVLPLSLRTTPFAAVDPLRAADVALRDALLAQQPTPGQRDLLADTWLISTAAEAAAFDTYRQIAARVREYRNGRTWTMVTKAADPLPTRVLPRGNWQDESGPLVEPSTPSFLPGRVESAEGRRLTRLDLARYLVSDDNPITSRAVVNRLWALFFGNGLSTAVDDLGSQGEPPSHPALLDWLASEFRASGWDVRHLIRLIVTSATYRQSSTFRPEVREIDPANRLLAAQNPRRLEAEFVRDNALFIAGALDLRDLGGPSAKPYQPAGYYAALQFPNRDYLASDADAQWRRGVYMHWQRAFLHPMLANFDAPARDECTAQRSVSNTPQQALTLLNDPTFVEAARLFASRIVGHGGRDDTARLGFAFQTALSRAAKPAELTSFAAFLTAQRATYRAAPADAEKLFRIGLSPPPSGDTVELAAWTSLARVLLNSQEVITRY